jgi:hypothetical protein
VDLGLAGTRVIVTATRAGTAASTGEGCLTVDLGLAGTRVIVTAAGAGIGAATGRDV